MLKMQFQAGPYSLSGIIDRIGLHVFVGVQFYQRDWKDESVIGIFDGSDS